MATTVTLQWDVSAGATTYWVCLDKTNNNACDTAWLSVGTAQSATLNDLAAGTTYYWQVEAQAGSTFTPADNGVWRSLSTQPETVPASFAKFGPLTTYTGINPVLTWQQSAGATNYQYCVDAAPDPTPNACDSNWVSVGTSLSVDLRGLTGGGTYLWQVRAQNASGITEATNGWATITSTYPSSSAFSKTSPAKGATVPSGFVTVAYTPSSTANYYVYCVDTIDNNSCDQPTGFTGQYFVIGGVHPTISIPVPDSGTRYYWQLVAVTLGAQHITAADAGLWHSFETTNSDGKPGAFWKTSSSPAGSNVTLAWASSLGAQGYEFCVDTINNNVCDTEWQLPSAPAGPATYAALGGLSASTAYFWQVRAANPAGTTQANSGAWRSFSTTSAIPGAFSKTGPANGGPALPVQAALSWQSNPQPSSYRVCVDKTNNQLCDVGWLELAGSLNATVRGATGTTYYWQVEAFNPNGSAAADHLVWWSFTTAGTNVCEVQHGAVVDNEVIKPSSGDAGAFESVAPAVPPSSLIPGQKGISAALHQALNAFASAYDDAIAEEDPAPDPPRPPVIRTSGFRPPAYQQHFRDLFEISAALGNLQPLGLSPGCQALLADVNVEIDTTHRINRTSGQPYTNSLFIRDQLPTVAQSGSSHHTVEEAVGVDIAKVNLNAPPVGFDVNKALKNAGLKRPYPKDKVHVTLLAQPARAAASPTDVDQPTTSLIIVGLPGVRVLVTDPLGRRIGYDPQSGTDINEVGSDAWYMGSSSALQVIAIFEGPQGDYTVSGQSTSSGPYEIRATEINESGDVVGQETWTGQAAPGQPVGPLPLPIVPPTPDETAPVVTAPASIVVTSSEIGGARPAAVPALAAFLIAGNATDDTDPSPQRLTAQIANQNVSSTTLFPVGTTTVTFRFQDANFNVGTATADVTVTSNVIGNGDFSSGTAGWQQFATPDVSYIVSTVVGGVFEYYRVPPPAGTTNQAVVFRETGFPVPIDTPLLAQFDLGNSSSVRKRISVLILDSNFSDLSVCTFWIPANSPLQTYQMQTHTTKAWTNAAIYFYAATAGSNGGAYRLDNVSLQYAPGESTSQTECFDPNVPAPPGGDPEPDLLVNGDFGTGSLPPWQLFGQITSQILNGVFEFIRTPGTPAGVILQSTGQSMNANQIMTATFDLGNSSPVRKRVTVILHDSNFSDLSACTFWLQPGQPLSSYVMRTYATQAWANATLSVYAATVGADQWIRLDNATFKRTPGTAITGTECAEPGAASAMDVSVSRPLASPVDQGLLPLSMPAGGVIDLTRAGRARLEFAAGLALNDGWVDVQVRTAGREWITIGTTVLDDVTTWLEIDLAPFLGEILEVRFVLHGVDEAVHWLPSVNVHVDGKSPS